MEIIIISDTHGNVANFKKVVGWANSKKIQTILHCGDIGDKESLEESLSVFKGEFLGVFGNMDQGSKVLIDDYNKISKVKVSENILETEIDKKRIAITHFPDTAKKLAQSGKFDIVFYGHTHRPWDERVPSGSGECHMINPGELAGQFYKPTFAIYDTSINKLELKILEQIGVD